MLMTSTRRKFARAPIQAPATCLVGPDRITATVWQIGEGGMLLDLPQAPTEPISIHFDLPGLGNQRVVAETAWASETPPRIAPAAKRGVGVRFKDIAPATRKSIAAYVKKMKQAYDSLQLALALNRPTPQLPMLLRETGLAGVSDRRELLDRVALVIAQLRIQA